jgi:hypothetical protein
MSKGLRTAAVIVGAAAVIVGTAGVLAGPATAAALGSVGVTATAASVASTLALASSGLALAAGFSAKKPAPSATGQPDMFSCDDRAIAGAGSPPPLSATIVWSAAT